MNCQHSQPFRQPSSVDDLKQVEDSATLSQLIRSNTTHYWRWLKINQKKYPELTAPLKYEGLIFGDPHMGNFAPAFVLLNSGKYALRFVPVDFDDIGQGPFIGDLIRFIIASEAVDRKSVKKKEIITSYLLGLKNPNMKLDKYLPDLIEDALAMTVDDFSQLQDKYVDKKTTAQKFKRKKDELVSYSNKSIRKDVTDLLKSKGYKVLDIVQKIVERGGSKDALRLWALVEGGKHGHIMEFKEWQETGISAYGEQTSLQERLKQLYPIFWPRLNPETYTIVDINKKPFFLREKHKSLLDIPYSANSDPERVFINKYSNACAIALGQIHGRQAAATTSWLKWLEQHSVDELEEILQPTIDDYLDLVEKEFDL